VSTNWIVLLYRKGERSHQILAATGLLGVVVALACGVLCFYLHRIAIARSDRIVRAEAAVSGGIERSEQACQRYLLTGDRDALGQYRRVSRDVDGSSDDLAAMVTGLRVWESDIDVLLAGVREGLKTWRRRYAQPAIEYRQSGDWHHLELFSRREDNIRWFSELESSLQVLHARLTLASRLRDQASQPARMAAGIGLAVGVLLALGSLIVIVPVGLRRLRWLLERSRLGESLTRFAEAAQYATSEDDLAEAISKTAIQVMDDAQSTVLLRKNGPGTLNVVALAGDGVEGNPHVHRSSPILGKSSLCPVMRTGQLHQVNDVWALTPCQCPLGVPIRGGYMCVPLLSGGHVHGLVNIQSASGATFGTNLVSEHLHTLGRVGSLAITSLHSLEVARRQAVTDDLTGTFNRRQFESYFAERLMEDPGGTHPISLLMMDLDQFKHFNDTHGHQAGDALLQHFSRNATRFVRGEDIFARYGGEEFVIVLPGTSKTQAFDIACRIKDSTRMMTLSGYPHLKLPVMTVSIGVSTFPEDGMTAEVLLRAADQSLYRAKEGGRDQVVMAESVTAS